jgi:hypothetical protein
MDKLTPARRRDFQRFFLIPLAIFLAWFGWRVF